EVAIGEQPFPPEVPMDPVQTGSTQMATPEQVEQLRRSRAGGTLSGEIGGGSPRGTVIPDQGQWNGHAGQQQGYDQGQWNQPSAQPSSQPGYDQGQWNQPDQAQPGYDQGQWNQPSSQPAAQP